MGKVILQPASNIEAFKHFQDTVRKPVLTSDILPYIKLDSEKNKIHQNDTALSLYKKTIESSVVTFRKLLRFIIHDDIPRKNISQGGYFYGKNDLDSLKFLQLNDHPDRISRIVRASYFPPFEPAYIKIGVSKHFIIPESGCLSYFGTKRPCNKSDWEY